MYINVFVLCSIFWWSITCLSCIHQDSQSLEWSLCGATMCLAAFCALLGVNEKRVAWNDLSTLNIFVALVLISLWIAMPVTTCHGTKHVCNWDTPGLAAPFWCGDECCAARQAEVQWSPATQEQWSWCLLHILLLEPCNLFSMLPPFDGSVSVCYRILQWWWRINAIAQLQAEPLAEDPPKEQLTGAAMCTTGHVLPGALPTLLS